MHLKIRHWIFWQWLIGDALAFSLWFKVKLSSASYSKKSHLTNLWHFVEHRGDSTWSLLSQTSLPSNQPKNHHLLPTVLRENRRMNRLFSRIWHCWREYIHLQDKGNLNIALLKRSDPEHFIWLHWNAAEPYPKSRSSSGKLDASSKSNHASKSNFDFF